MKEKLIQAFKNKGFNIDVLNEWTEFGEVIIFFNNEDNICVLVKFEGDEDEYSFQRYFSVGTPFQRYFSGVTQTVCSVDKNFSMTDAPELIANLLNAKYE